MISLVSPLTYNLTAGESQSFDLGEVFNYYSIIGNNTEVDIEVIQEGTIVTITPNKYFLDDIFEIIFFNQEKEVIYQSGGSKTRTIIKEVEIPTYLDKETVIEVNNTIEKEIEIEKGKGIVFLLYVFGAIIVCFIIRFIYSKIIERRYEEI